MFLRIQTKRNADGSERLYASVVENERVKGKVVQTTLVNIGRGDPGQVPYLRAAWDPSDRPSLVWPDGRRYDPPAPESE